MRPLSYPHQEVFASARLDGEAHRFTLVAVIGGKGLAPTPGELSVSYGPPGDVPRLLGGLEALLLTSEEWERYADEPEARHRREDKRRRREASAPVAAAWDEYHRRVREWMERTPATAPPRVAATG